MSAAFVLTIGRETDNGARKRQGNFGEEFIARLLGGERLSSGPFGHDVEVLVKGRAERLEVKTVSEPVGSAFETQPNARWAVLEGIARKAWIARVCISGGEPFRVVGVEWFRADWGNLIVQKPRPHHGVMQERLRLRFPSGTGVREVPRELKK